MLDKTEHFKNKLITLKDEISHRISNIDKDIRHVKSADWQEQATERENDEVLDSLSRSSAQKLLSINTALQRIEVDEYFSCNLCGEFIPIARLELLPFTTHCVGCAEHSQH